MNRRHASDLRPVLMAALLMVWLPLQAQDRADLDRTRIVGNRELPKVTYIVPWKKPLPDALGARPPSSVLDEALAPVDPEVHRRQVAWHARLLQAAAPPAAAALAAGTAEPARAAAPPPPPQNPVPPQEKRP